MRLDDVLHGGVGQVPHGHGGSGGAGVFTEDEQCVHLAGHRVSGHYRLCGPQANLHVPTDTLQTPYFTRIKTLTKQWRLMKIIT